MDTTFASIADAIAAAREADQVSMAYEAAHATFSDETRAESNRLCDDMSAAEDVAIGFPVVTAADLLVKVGFINERGAWGQDNIGALISADVARIVGDRAPWDQAFAAWQNVKKETDAFDALYAAADETNQNRMSDAWVQNGDRLYTAEWALFAIPAPDHAALAWKSEKLFGDEVARQQSSACWRADIIAAYMVDVRRLLSGEGR